MKLIDTFLGFHGPREKFGFPGQQEGEEVEYLTTQHWIKLLPFFSLFLLSIVLFVAIYSTLLLFIEVDRFVLFAFGTILVAVLFHILALQLFYFSMNVLIVTNYRLIDVRQSVYLKREKDTIDLQNVQDIHFRQSGVWQRLFNYGTLEIFGSSIDVEYRIHHVPDIEKVHSMICHIHRSAMLRRDTLSGSRTFTNPSSLQG